MLTKVFEVVARDGFRLWCRFSDGAEGEVDLSELIGRDGPLVRPLKGASEFARVFLEAGAPTWPNGFDLAPWALRKFLDAKV